MKAYRCEYSIWATAAWACKLITINTASLTTAEEEAGKCVEEMNSELNEGNYSTSSLRINN